MLKDITTEETLIIVRALSDKFKIKNRNDRVTIWFMESGYIEIGQNNEVFACSTDRPESKAPIECGYCHSRRGSLVYDTNLGMLLHRECRSQLIERK